MECCNFPDDSKIIITHFLLVLSLRKTVKCYILTEDSKTVHFDIDEDGHHEISTKDSQSHEGNVLYVLKLTNCMCSTQGIFKYVTYP